MQNLGSCPVCAGAPRTPVCEYNRLILFDDHSRGSERYDYALCHGCGVVYASRRPDPEELRGLWSSFDDVVGRSTEVDRPLRIHPVDAAAREELRRRLSRGAFVSIESDPADSEWLPDMQSDREGGAPHLDLLLSLLPAARPRRALEIRSKTGYLLDGLRRHRGTEVYAMPLFESQQLVIREAFEIPADSLLDEAAFEIPYDGQFDLIIAKHQFVHALAPDDLFAAIRERLAPGGHLYVWAELDDSVQLKRGRSIFYYMVPFHLQAFDPATLGRVLRTQGFDPTFMTRVGGEIGPLACLATLSPGVEPDRMRASTLNCRLRYYQRWRDWSILKLSTTLDEDRLNDLFGDDLDEVRSRAIGEGWAELRKGRVRLSRNGGTDPAVLAPAGSS